MYPKIPCDVSPNSRAGKKIILWDYLPSHWVVYLCLTPKLCLDSTSVYSVRGGIDTLGTNPWPLAVQCTLLLIFNTLPKDPYWSGAPWSIGTVVPLKVGTRLGLSPGLPCLPSHTPFVFFCIVLLSLPTPSPTWVCLASTEKKIHLGKMTWNSNCELKWRWKTCWKLNSPGGETIGDKLNQTTGVALKGGLQLSVPGPFKLPLFSAPQN